MQRGDVSVEANLIEKRARMRSEKRVTYKDENMASTSSSDVKINNLVRVMERMMEIINLSERKPPRENQENLQNRNRNPNFRRDPPQKYQETMTNKLGPLSKKIM